MKAYLYCTKAKPYLYNSVGNFIVNIEWKETGKKPYYTLCKKIDEFQHLELNGQVVARCICRNAYRYKYVGFDEDDESHHYQGYLPQDNAPEGIQFTQRAGITYREAVDYGKGKDFYAYHLERVEALEKPMQISDFYSDIVCTKPLKRAPQSFQKAYRKIYVPKDEALDDSDYYAELCYLFSDRSPYVAKILNGEKDLEIRKSMIKELKKRKGGE